MWQKLNEYRILDLNQILGVLCDALEAQAQGVRCSRRQKNKLKKIHQKIIKNLRKDN